MPQGDDSSMSLVYSLFHKRDRVLHPSYGELSFEMMALLELRYMLHRCESNEKRPTRSIENLKLADRLGLGAVRQGHQKPRQYESSAERL